MSEKFLNLGLCAEFEQMLEKIGITEPTPVQCRAIPEVLLGKNVIGQSATGTGKTFAYLLPLLQEIDGARPCVQIVILAPTYELAMQIYHQAELVIKSAGVKATCVSLIGGANIARQIDKLKTKPQVIVGSAGRIVELQKKGKLKLEQVRAIVLDEADRLLDDQNMTTVKTVIKSVPPTSQFLLFSATIPPGTITRADFVQDPVLIQLKDDLILQPKIENIYFIAEFRDKIEVLRKIARILNIKRGLVFVNRKDDLLRAVEKLKFHGLAVAALIGESDKMERKQAIADFAGGKVQLLVASDLAARGLDIADIDYVVNLDLPEDEKVYLHRAGRTGRAGKSGCAISIAAPKEISRLTEIARKIKVELSPKRLALGEIQGPKTAGTRRPRKKEFASRPKRVKASKEKRI